MSSVPPEPPANPQTSPAPAQQATAASDAAASPPAPGPAPVAASGYLYIGSGDWGTATGAVSVYRFDSSSGGFSFVSKHDAGGLLSFLDTDSDHRLLYAADEGAQQLRSFQIDPSSGSLQPLATTSTIAGPVYVSVSSDDRFILAAQFNSGRTEVFALDDQGQFGERTANVDSGGESHSVVLTPDERYALVPGRASDRIAVFAFNREDGSLTPHGHVALPQGAGCRHVDFHPDGKTLYLVNEFANDVVRFSYDAEPGRFEQLQSISTLPEGFRGKSSAADIHVHPNGRFVYASNRPEEADGSIVVYAVGPEGALSVVEHESTLGRVPRNFEITPDGQFLIVGNQESKSVVTFRIDPQSGQLDQVFDATLDVKPFFVGYLGELASP